MSHGSADGSDQTFINNSYATWDVGDVKNATINTEYIRAGADIYVFVTDKVYTYTMYVYEYPYGSISEAEVVKTIECTYKPSDVVNQDDKECIKLDCETIDIKLESLGYNSENICYVYASDFYDDWEGLNCNSWIESRKYRWK